MLLATMTLCQNQPETLTSVMHDSRRSVTVTLSFLILEARAGELEMLNLELKCLSSKLSDLIVICVVVAFPFCSKAQRPSLPCLQAKGVSVWHAVAHQHFANMF